jgi:hypothetical protein
MKRESAMQRADERQKSVAARRKTVLKANGRMLMRTMAVLVFFSNACAKPSTALAFDCPVALAGEK